MSELAPLIKDLAIILGIAGIVTLLFQKIRQPVVLGYLVAGIIIGPYTPPYSLVTDISNIKTLAELGVIFLMFSLGLDFSFHKLTRVGFSASVTGLVEVVLMLVLGFITGQALGWSFNDSLFLGAAISISSTTIIIKALEELNLKHKHFAELIFGVLVVEDLLAILLLVALSTIVVTKHIFSMPIVVASTKLILVVGSWFLIGYFLVPPLFRRVMRYISSETLTIVAVALCLLLVCVADYFHYAVSLGAFIMGSILAETRAVHRIETLTRPIRDVFAAVFFVSVGMLIDPKIILMHWPIILCITAVTMFGKIITSGLGAFLTGQNYNTSLRIGFSMAQIGELSFIIAGLGLILGATSKSLYPIIVAVSGITTFTTPYLIRFSGFVSNTLDKRLSPRTKVFLGSYLEWLHRVQNNRKPRPIYRKAVIRFLVNGLIVASIFTICQHLLLPELGKVIQPAWLTKELGWGIAIIISSPFIWAMLFTIKISARNQKISLPLIILPISIFFVLEISLFSIFYFSTWMSMLILIVLAIGFFLLLHRQLGKIYNWFEKHLIYNLNKIEEFSHFQFEKLAPWDTHLVQLSINHHSTLLGKTFVECQLRQQFGINIVAIHRDSKTLLAPRGNQRFLPNDKLIVLGSDAQIDQFKIFADQIITEENSDYFLENFVLKKIAIKSDNIFIGQSIRESKIREQTCGLIVGLERTGVRTLNPDPSIVLEKNDLLLVIGESQALKGY